MAKNVYPQGESKTLELKKCIPKKNQIIKTCVAFANGAGGEIVIGIEDKTRKIIGVSNEVRDKVFDKIANSIIDSITPYLNPEIFERNIHGKIIVIIKIYPGNRTPYFIKSEKHQSHAGVYLRVASSTRQASEQYIKDLHRQQENIYFDEEASKLAFSNLNKSLLNEIYHKKSSEEKYIMGKVAVRNIKNPRNIMATNAAVLFFSNNPEIHIPEALVICSQFKGEKGRKIIRTTELKGPIPYLVESTLKLLESWLEVQLKISDSGRLKGRLLIPKTALREAIINALIHRTYFINSAVKISFYENRLEIFSPGGFPGLISIESLGDGTTFLRNPTIARLAREYKLIEKLGSGIRMIFNSCKRHKLKKPEFQENGNFVKLIFYFKTFKKSHLLNKNLSHENQIIQLGKKLQKFRIKDILENIDISRNTATRKINHLIKKKLFKRYGQGAGIYFKYIGSGGKKSLQDLS